MNDIGHLITSWSSSLIILIMGVVLTAISIPYTPQWRHFSKARICLATSYFILGYAKLMECVHSMFGITLPERNLIVLAVSFSQALLFTGTALTFISPLSLNKKIIYRQICIIVVVMAIITSTYLFLPSMYTTIFKIGALAYLIQMGAYTFTFWNEYRKGMQLLEDHYYDAYADRLKWIKRFFYSAMGIGLISIIMIIFPISQYTRDIFVVFYTVYYVYVVLCVVRYRSIGGYIVDAISEENDTEEELNTSNRKHTTPSEKQGEATIFDTLQERRTNENASENLNGNPQNSTFNKGKKISEAMIHALKHAQAVKESQKQKAEKAAKLAVEKITMEEPQTMAPLSAQEQELEIALEKWAKEEKYLYQDISAKEIAEELGTTPTFLNMYFIQHRNMLFRTWRMNLRIEKAQHILAEDPNIKISDLYTLVGFADKSHFYRQFKDLTGLTPNEYRKQITIEEKH